MYMNGRLFAQCRIYTWNVTDLIMISLSTLPLCQLLLIFTATHSFYFRSTFIVDYLKLITIFIEVQINSLFVSED